MLQKTMLVTGQRDLGMLMRHGSDRHAGRRWTIALAVAVALAASAGSASAQQQEPSWIDRTGDFFKRFLPGGGPPEQAQPQPAQQAPTAAAPAGPPAPAAQAPAART